MDINVIAGICIVSFSAVLCFALNIVAKKSEGECADCRWFNAEHFCCDKLHKENEEKEAK